MGGFARIVTCEQVASELELAAAGARPSTRVKLADVGAGGKGGSDCKEKHTMGNAAMPEEKKTHERKDKDKDDETTDQCLGAVRAMLVALEAAGVRAVRFTVADTSGSVRAKAISLQHVKKKNDPTMILEGPGFVECLFSLPIYGDAPAAKAGLTSSLLQLRSM